jgi:hypothetical protein
MCRQVPVLTEVSHDLTGFSFHFSFTRYVCNLYDPTIIVIIQGELLITHEIELSLNAVMAKIPSLLERVV